MLKQQLRGLKIKEMKEMKLNKLTKIFMLDDQKNKLNRILARNYKNENSNILALDIGEEEKSLFS